MGRREVVRQADYGFGEISDDYAASDADAKKRSLKRGLNLRILNSYGVSQRFGSRRMATATGPGINIELITSQDVSLVAVVRAGGADIYTQDGALLQSVNGAPWSAVEASELVWHARKDTAYFAHKSYWPRVLTLANGIWSWSLFGFDGGAGNSVLQPYYRFAPAGITLTPGGYTGSIPIQFSGDVLTAAHIGVRFRYGASSTTMKEMVITAVADARNGTATVLDTLAPTFNVTVDATGGFRAGEDVQGLDSNAQGVITTVVDATNLTVLMASGFESFLTGAAAEYLVGPYSRSKVSATSQNASPAPSTVWDEAAMSPARGYPGAVYERSGRLGFADLPQLPGAVILSSPGSRQSFDVGKGEAQDAIFFVLDEGGQRVRYCISAACLLILTDKKVYFVPEDENTPLAANTFQPIEVGPTGTSGTFPVTVEEGLVFVENGGNRVMGVLATGNVTAPFQITDLSRHASHLVKNPVSLAMTNGNSQAPERYIFALNEDGTLACMFYDNSPPRLGLTPWETDGLWLAMVSIKGIIYALCERVIGADTVHLLERLDAGAQMDASSLFSVAGTYLPLTTDSGEALVDDAGDSILTELAAIPQLAGQTVQVIRGTEYLGEFEVAADGSIADLGASDGDFEAGRHFNTDMTLWPPEAQDDQRTMFARRRISHVAVRTQNSASWTVGLLGRSQINTRPPYDQGDDFSLPPPLRSEVKRWALAGYEYEPCIQILRPLPQPLTVLSVAQEVVVT